MNCPRCHKPSEGDPPRCPHCGARNEAASGVFQTSTVLISTGRGDRVYRSVDEVPARLRNRLIKTTNGVNSATILIADRKGRKEIDKAMRKVPGQRKLVQAILGGQPITDPLAWFTPPLRRWLAGIVVLLALIFAVAVFLYHAR